MPFITDEQKKKIDPKLDKLLARSFSTGEVSYILLRVLTQTTGRDVADVIRAMGILEDVKATYRKYRYDNLEERVLFERWLERDGDYQ